MSTELIALVVVVMGVVAVVAIVRKVDVRAKWKDLEFVVAGGVGESRKVSLALKRHSEAIQALVGVLQAPDDRLDDATRNQAYVICESIAVILDPHQTRVEIWVTKSPGVSRLIAYPRDDTAVTLDSDSIVARVVKNNQTYEGTNAPSALNAPHPGPAYRSLYAHPAGAAPAWGAIVVLSERAKAFGKVDKEIVERFVPLATVALWRLTRAGNR